MELEVESHKALLKVGLFVLVQALVYLILSQSSTVFPRTKSLGRTSTVFSRTKSLGLRPARSVSSRRMLALLSDLLLGGEPSPVSVAGKKSPVPADRKMD